mgnify:CR=1 FL=1
MFNMTTKKLGATPFITMNNIWSFSDPPSVAVFTTASIVNGTEWIAYVYHDEEDGAWQFHSLNSNTDEDEARIVSLKSITEIDNSVIALADLPLGWKACRQNKSDEWIRCIDARN